MNSLRLLILLIFLLLGYSISGQPICDDRDPLEMDLRIEGPNYPPNIFTGEDISVTLTVNNFIDVLNFNFTIIFDPTVLCWIDSEDDFENPSGNLRLGDLSQSVFEQASNGFINFSWFSNATTIPDGEDFITLHFTVCGEPEECSNFCISDQLGISTLVVYELSAIDACIYEEVVLNKFAPDELCVGCDDLSIYDVNICPSNLGSGARLSFKVCGGTGPYTYEVVNANNIAQKIEGTIDDPGDQINIPLIPFQDFDIRVRDADGSLVIKPDNGLLAYSIADIEPLGFDVNRVNPICSGGEGSILVTDLTGGNTFDIEISNGVFRKGTTDDQTIVVSEGLYNLTVTNDYGCSDIATVEILTPPMDTINVMITPPDCIGANNGQLIVSATGGTPFPNNEYEFNGTIGANLVVDGPASAAQPPWLFDLDQECFNVTIKDANGCQNTICVPIPVATRFDFSLEVIPPLCQEDGYAIQLNQERIPGSVLVYALDDENNNPVPGASGPNFFRAENLDQGIYSIEIQQRDQSNPNLIICSDTLQVEIPEFNLPILELNVVENQPACGELNGSGQVMVTGGVPNYSYAWPDFPGNITNEIVDVEAGSYIVSVTDENGCIKEAVIDLEQGQFLSAKVDTTQLLDCTDPTILASYTSSVSTSFDQADLIINWLDDQGTIVQTGPSYETNNSGDFVLEITTTDGSCVARDSFMIEAPETIEYSINFINPGSCGGNTVEGSIEIVSSNPNVRVCWDSDVISFPLGYKNPSIPDLPRVREVLAGNYYITVADALSGCSVLDTIELTESGSVNFMSEIISPTCQGRDDGEITISGPLAGPTLSAEWEHGPSGLNVGQLSAGEYRVTISDDNGCVDSINLFVVDPEPTTLLVRDLFATICFDSFDGEAIAQINENPNGYTEFSFVWSNPADNDTGGTEDNATQLAGGENWVYAFDENNACPTDTVRFNIERPDSLFVREEFKFISVSCNGAADGIFDLSTDYAQGGTAPNGDYELAFENGIDPNALAVGAYEVIITDEEGCTETDSIFVSEPDSLFINIVEVKNIGCDASSAGGQIAVASTGGCGDYQYQWTDNVSTDSLATNLAEGRYTIIVEDACGCTAMIDTIITGGSEVQGELLMPEPLTCEGDLTCIGVDPSTVSGGTGVGYVFNINNTGDGIPIDSCIMVGPGSYLISLFDSEGCDLEIGSVTIDEAPALQVDLGPDIDLELGESNVNLTVELTGSSVLDSINWTPAESVECLNEDCDMVAFTATENTTYLVTVTDNNGCTATDEINLNLTKPRRLYRPNLLIPGNDLNGKFMLQTGRGVERIIDFYIYDRWGNLMFELDEDLGIHPTSRDDGWDGTFNGRGVESGVYVWIANVLFVDGVTIKYKGQLTLLN